MLSDRTTKDRSQKQGKDKHRSDTSGIFCEFLGRDHLDDENRGNGVIARSSKALQCAEDNSDQEKQLLVYNRSYKDKDQ